jgi:hypothetical protein
MLCPDGRRFISEQGGIRQAWRKTEHGAWLLELLDAYRELLTPEERQAANKGFNDCLALFQREFRLGHYTEHAKRAFEKNEQGNGWRLGQLNIAANHSRFLPICADLIRLWVPEIPEAIVAPLEETLASFSPDP